MDNNQTNTRSTIHSDALRSEETREFMSRMPNWMISYGISLLFVLLLLVLTFSAFIRYPDRLEGQIILGSSHPVQMVTAQNSGKLASIWTKDQAIVNKGDWLAVLENPASISDIQDLIKLTQSFSLPSIQDSLVIAHHWPSLSLGEIQTSYHHFIQLYSKLFDFVNQPYYTKKLTSFENQKRMMQLYYNRLWEQRMNLEDQLLLAGDKWQADSLLFSQKVIASLTYKQSRSDYLQKQHNFHGARAQLAQTGIQLEEITQTIVELKQERESKRKTLFQDLSSAREDLISHIKRWEQKYLLKAEIDGKLEFQEDLLTGLYVQAGFPLMTVVPLQTSRVYASASIPVKGASKLKPGQTAYIYLDDYAYPENGQLEGQIASVSKIPIRTQNSEPIYRAEISLPEDWITTFGKQIDLQQRMSGRVEVITQEVSLLEKLFFRWRKLTHPKP